MNQDIINTVTAFGKALVEGQHKYFSDESIDNLEHVPAIKRIADTTYQYLIANGISFDNCTKVKEELIRHGKDLFIKLWMQNIIEDGEIPSKKDLREAERTFEKILKTGKVS